MDSNLLMQHCPICQHWLSPLRVGAFCEPCAARLLAELRELRGNVVLAAMCADAGAASVARAIVGGE